MFYYARKLTKQGFKAVIGVDEVGIGPLAGPVVAAAVLLETTRFKNRVDDSKKLSANQREKAFLELNEKSVFGVGIVNEKVIDRLNIHGATCVAMEQAVDSLLKKLRLASPHHFHILIDGTIRPSLGFPFTNIIKGDTKSKSIASASIIAKVTRDRIMLIYDKVFPQYGFKQHKGYPTYAHRNALRKFGASIIHRMSFRHD